MLSQKKIIFSAIIIMFNCSGCFMSNSPVGLGLIVTNLKAPIEVAEKCDVDRKNLKVGMAECINILGLLAIGDCSMEAAMKSSNIKKVCFVDTKIKSFLFLHVTTNTIIYGE